MKPESPIVPPDWRTTAERTWPLEHVLRIWSEPDAEGVMQRHDDARRGIRDVARKLDQLAISRQIDAIFEETDKGGIVTHLVAVDEEAGRWTQLHAAINSGKPLKVCSWCGNPFPLRRAGAQVCSSTCRARVSEARAAIPALAGEPVHVIREALRIHVD